MSGPRACARSTRAGDNRLRSARANLVALTVRAVGVQASTAVSTSHRPDKGYSPVDSPEGEFSRAMFSSRKKLPPGKSSERGERLARVASDVLPRSIRFAQFIGVCSNAKTCEIGENLLSVSGPISRPQERLIHAGALVRPRTLQRRPVSILHPYAPVERAPAAMSPVPEPRRRSLEHISLP